MIRLALLLSLLLVATNATAEPPATKTPAAVKAVAPAKATTKVVPVVKALPTKVVTKTVIKTETKIVTKVETKSVAPTSAPAKKPAASQPTSAPASQPAAASQPGVPKDTAGAITTGQQFIRDLQRKDWRHAASVLLMLLIFVWRRYGEKFLALHKVPDRYLGFVTAGVAVLYALGLALGTKGAFDWSAFISNAVISGGESMLAWELGGKFLLEKTLGPTPAKLRRRAAMGAAMKSVDVSNMTPTAALAAVETTADAAVKIENDKPADKK
jgi:hypothetical protein